MRSPEDVRALLARRFQRLQGQLELPLEVALGRPREAEALARPEVVRGWVKSWQEWTGPGELLWKEQRWRRLGPQRLPDRVLVATFEELAGWAGAALARAASRLGELVGRYPEAGRFWEFLTACEEDDWERLAVVLRWLEENPTTDVFARQLPIAGLDSKWVERHHSLVRELTGRTFRPLPPRVRLRLLCPALRRCVAGLGDLKVPLNELATWEVPVRRVFIVENVQTGLAFGDVPGAVVLMGLGYAVGWLSSLPWLASLPCVYWGDLDTHGFAILHRARRHLPHLRSVLMDEGTLLRHRALWVEELEPATTPLLAQLTVEEALVYEGLRTGRWGERVRLEQERVDWGYAWERVLVGTR